jgi:uncharacterized membrane protein YfcA
MALSIIIGFLSGIISGMGIGGGAILIPALIFFQGVGQQMAQGINLTYFLPTAIFALIVHIRNKRVRIKTALCLAAFGVVGAFLGARIATAVDGELLRRLFGGFLAFVGFYEIWKGFRIKSH